MYLCADDFEKIILSDGTEVTGLIDIDHVATGAEEGLMFNVTSLTKDGKLESHLATQKNARFIKKDGAWL